MNSLAILSYMYMYMYLFFLVISSLFWWTLQDVTYILGE